jgi:hypothetical protein
LTPQGVRPQIRKVVRRAGKDDRMSRGWIAGLAVAVTLPLLFSGADAQAEGERGSKDPTLAVEVSGQTRLRIYPRARPRGGELRPGDLWYYPGPNAVRQCRSWLQREFRPSGPVVTPQMRCWWVPG